MEGKVESERKTGRKWNTPVPETNLYQLNDCHYAMNVSISELYIALKSIYMCVCVRAYIMPICAYI